MIKKVLDKVEDLVLFKAKPTPEQQVKELDEQIEDLKKKRQRVLDGVGKKYVNKMLSRIMGQWVIVGGWSDDDEHPFHGQHYTESRMRTIRPLKNSVRSSPSSFFTSGSVVSRTSSSFWYRRIRSSMLTLLTSIAAE